MTIQKVQIKLTKQSKKNLDLLRNLGNDVVRDTLLRFFDMVGSEVAGKISKEFLSGQRLKRRTGTLARSIIGRGILLNGVPGVRVGVFRGPALAYAGIQETGGTIKPKKAKALAIPTEEGGALTPAGVHRYQGPRDFPRDLTFIPFRSSGVAVGGLFDTESIKEAPRPADIYDYKLVYLLVRQVEIPAQNYLIDGFRLFLPQIIEELSDAIVGLVLSPRRG